MTATSGLSTCCDATSPRPARTSGGWPTSPTWPPGPGLSTSRSSSTCSPGRSSAGPPPPASGPSSSSTSWTWRCGVGTVPELPLARGWFIIGCGQSVHVFRVHRPPSRGRHRRLDRHRRGRPGQRPHGIPDRPLLLRSTPAPTGGWSQRIEPPPIPERFIPPPMCCPRPFRVPPQASIEPGDGAVTSWRLSRREPCRSCLSRSFRAPGCTSTAGEAGLP